jgi:hypothetical protein
VLPASAAAWAALASFGGKDRPIGIDNLPLCMARAMSTNILAFSGYHKKELGRTVQATSCKRDSQFGGTLPSGPGAA